MTKVYVVATAENSSVGFEWFFKKETADKYINGAICRDYYTSSEAEEVYTEDIDILENAQMNEDEYN